MIRSLSQLPVEGRRVLVRVDFNVPLASDGTVRDDTRIRASLPTLQSILERGGIPVVMSHLGRPKGKRVPELSLQPVAQHLAALLGRTVHFAPDCIGSEAAATVARAAAGEVVLLENLRFHAGEEANDPAFAAELAALGDAYVNDAFGAAHRAHASTSAIASYFPGRKAMGLLMERELTYLRRVFENPPRPFVAVIGGAKIADKLGVLKRLLEFADYVLVGGGIANTFFAAQGVPVGSSIVDERYLDHAALLHQQYHNKLYLPTDVVIADELSDAVPTSTVALEALPDDPELKILDIGPQTQRTYSQIITEAALVVWNGPMGAFEFKPFRSGTLAIASAVAEATSRGATTIVGGGDSIAALSMAHLTDRVSHISTGGGATLEFLEGKQLPGVVALEE